MHDKHWGYMKAISAYTLWGIFPLYWKLLREVSSLEVICHRILWSLLTLFVCITFLRQWNDIVKVLGDIRRLALCSLAACLISINWLVFIWAVQHGFVVESSLGYFINPILTVLLAVGLFRERIRPLQWVSIGIAFLGVAIMTIETGRFPWIAFLLSTSFASYAAVKKRTTLPAISGLGMETAILAPLSVMLLLYFRNGDQLGVPGVVGWLSGIGIPRPSAGPTDTNIWLLLALGGPVTTLPLVLFASAAKSVPLVAMGMLQYVGPTLQFLLGVWLYQEEVTIGKAVGFVFVWLALALFTWSTILFERKRSSIESS